MTLRRPRTPRDLVSLREGIERLFDESFPFSMWGEADPAGRPSIPIDIVEDPDRITVRASVPGVKAEDLHVEIEDDRFRIWAEIEEEAERREDSYVLRERSYGRVERTGALPGHVDPAAATAEIEDGVLTLVLPKAPGDRHREVHVKAKG